jgi:hypothetical protein
MNDAQLLAALRSRLDASQLPHRETDPAGYIVAQSRTVEDQGHDLSPEDKALAMGIFRAGFTFTAEAEDED